MTKMLFISILFSVLIQITSAQISSPAWISGSNLGNQNGTYGTIGIASSSNIPGGRNYAVSWIDSNDTLWLFGGRGYPAAGSLGWLNDLWKYDGMNWTWISGSDVTNQRGNYGTQGITSALNIPGARIGAISWIDSNNNLWLFGGHGYSRANSGYLNDLWKFDGVNWTWISGSDVTNQNGTYGTIGIASSSNIPGSRWDTISWIDSNNNLWLFGGFGYAATSNIGRLNDLWKFDGVNWTWISGSNSTNQYGIYGTQGIASALNIPGARIGAASWKDSNDTLWLFGGEGFAATGSPGWLNDLWKFDGMNWTWISGSHLTNQRGNYGTQGIASSSNIPGCRIYAISWIDSNNNLWLFGGNGFVAIGGGERYFQKYKNLQINKGWLNDLWKFDGMNWIWISGSNLGNQNGTYGTQGIASSSNIPGGRNLAVSWIDSNDTLWLFGGSGRDAGGIFGFLNDLWRFSLSSLSTTGSLTSNSLTTSPVTSSPVTSRSFTTAPITTSPLSTGEITSAQFTSGDATSSFISTQEIINGISSIGRTTLSTVVIVLIIIGVIILIVIGILIIFVIRKQRRKQPSKSELEMEPDTST